jgi:predicted nucleic acid-binding Zn ribbon protein
MITYKYKCKNNHECDIEERITEHGKIAHICVECGELLETVITGGAGIFFEGVGWEKDGYANHGHACDKDD